MKGSILLGCLLSSLILFGQTPRMRSIDSSFFIDKKDVIDLMVDLKIKDSSENALTQSKRLGKKVRFSVLPSVAAGPRSPGIGFVTAIGATFILGSPQTTNLSTIYFTPYTNFKGKFIFPIRSYIWSKDNNWNFVGDFRYLIFPDKTYGLGSNTRKADLASISYNQFTFHQSVLRKLFGYFLLGGGLHIDHYSDIQEYESESSKRYLEIYDGEMLSQTQSNGVSITASIDSRLNSVNAQRGYYLATSYWYTPKWMNSTYEWHSVFTEFKTYHSFNPKRQNLIAFWAYYWDVFSGKAPYLDLPSTFNDPNYRSGRGYYPGRFRGNAMLYLETEYRFDLTKNGLWGATVYTNMQTLRNPSTQQFEKWAPAAGIGLRLKFNKYSNMNLGFDLGVGRESWNYFFNIGEYF